jgi:hypothetical protein
VTELACLDGPARAAVSDQLMAVYRAAMAAPPFFETEVETGWFADELAGELDEAGKPDPPGTGAGGCPHAPPPRPPVLT